MSLYVWTTKKIVSIYANLSRIVSGKKNQKCLDEGDPISFYCNIDNW